jgi:hypothetical protein
MSPTEMGDGVWRVGLTNLNPRKMMPTTIEIDKPLVAALRTSEALPNTHEHGSGNLHILYGDHYHPVGYLVEKVAVDDPWDSLDPRFFITTSHAEALRLLATAVRELPAREARTT